MDSKSVINFNIEDNPYELCLSLIRTHSDKASLEEAILEISLAKITDRFIEIVKNMGFVDLDKNTEFIKIASELLEIKSYSLLPKVEMEDDSIECDTELEADLKERLIEYAKECSATIEPMEIVGRTYRSPEYDENDFNVVISNFDLDKLIEAYVKVLHKVSVRDKEDYNVKVIEKEVYTVYDKILYINELLKSNSSLLFFQLFDKDNSKQAVINTFLALLEMLKLQYVSAVQDDEGEIIITKSTTDKINVEELANEYD